MSTPGRQRAAAHAPPRPRRQNALGIVVLLHVERKGRGDGGTRYGLLLGAVKENVVLWGEKRRPQEQ